MCSCYNKNHNDTTEFMIRIDRIIHIRTRKKEHTMSLTRALYSLRTNAGVVLSCVAVVSGIIVGLIYMTMNTSVQALSRRVVATAAGGDHSLALASDGTVYAWGYGADGRLGNGSTTNSSVPVAVTTAGTPMAGKTITQIAAGSGHSLALASDGTVYAWGYGAYGRLGNGSTTNSSVPVAVTTAGTPMAGTPSEPNTIVANPGNGSISFSWRAPIETYGRSITGYSLEYRVLGAGSWTKTAIPGQVTSYVQSGLGNGQTYQVRLAAVTAAGTGEYSSIMLATPRNMTVTSVTPNAGSVSGGHDVTITGTDLTLRGKDIVQLEAGYYHTLLLDAEGVMYSWGDNEFGQLGTSTSTTSRGYPDIVDVTGTPLEGKRVTKIAAGYDTSFAITSDGTVYSWGDNSHGQLGRGSMGVRSNPQPQEVVTVETPMAGKAIVSIESNQATTVALDSAGVLYSWGYNEHGELGQGTEGAPTITPALVTTAGTSIQDKRITKVSSGEYGFFVISQDGTAHAWGRNQYGELGNGTSNIGSNVPAPVLVDGTPMEGKIIVDIDGGIWHTLAVDSEGAVYAWGDGEFSQLGNGQHGTGVESSVPLLVDPVGTPMAGKKIVSVSAGGNNYYLQQILPSSHSVVLADDDSIYTWGTSHAGEIGNGGSAGGAQYDRPVAVATSGTPMAGKSSIQISTGIFSTFALSSEGRVYSWGINEYGELGDDTTINRNKPVAVATTAPSALAPSTPLVTFGTTPATNVILVNSTTITARTPAHSSGVVDVNVDLGDSLPRYVATKTNGYTYGTVPGAPTALTATPRDDGVQLNWTAPASNGGVAITDYVIQYSSDNGVTWQVYDDGVSTTTNTLIPTPTPLNTTATYSFRVAAVNFIGQGPQSTIVTGRVRYITVAAAANVTINVTPMGGTRMSSASHLVTVSTNGVLGYQLMVGSTSTNRNLINDSYLISPSSGTQISPVVLSGTSWGYRVVGIGGFGSGSGVEANTTVSSYTWAGITETSSPATIRTQTAATTNQSTTVWYGVSVTPQQKSGSYSGGVMYTAITRD